jgi:hypothetical protein
LSFSSFSWNSSKSLMVKWLIQVHQLSSTWFKFAQKLSSILDLVTWVNFLSFMCSIVSNFLSFMCSILSNFLSSMWFSLEIK